MSSAMEEVPSTERATPIYDAMHPPIPLDPALKRLEAQHPHPRDKLARYQPTDRAYFYNSPTNGWSRSTLTVTSMVYGCFPAFDQVPPPPLSPAPPLVQSPLPLGSHHCVKSKRRFAHCTLGSLWAWQSPAA